MEGPIEKDARETQAALTLGAVGDGDSWTSGLQGRRGSP